MCVALTEGTDEFVWWNLQRWDTHVWVYRMGQEEMERAEASLRSADYCG